MNDCVFNDLLTVDIIRNGGREGGKRRELVMADSNQARLLTLLDFIHSQFKEY